MRQRGARPSAEFVEGVQRKRPSRQGYAEAEVERADHIDLRVVSMVEVDTNPDFHEWNDLMIDIGRSNHAKGTARSLGSIAITYIPSKHLNNMLRERYTRDYHDPQKKVKLFRRVNSGLKDCIRDSAALAYDKRITELTVEHELRLEKQREYVAAGIGGSLDIAEVDWLEDDATEYDMHERLRAAEHPFGPYTMKVKGIDLYGRGKKYGIDLSLNDSIYDVRNGLIRHLSKAEGLDVSSLRRDWDAHATIFDLHDHMGAAPLVRHQEVPDVLRFDAPDTEMFIVPRSAA